MRRLLAHARDSKEPGTPGGGDRHTGLRCDPVKPPIRTLEHGPEDAPVALLLHGLPGGAEDWNRLGPLLAAGGFRAVAVDRPGYGGSGDEPLAVAEQVDAFAQLLRERGGAPAFVVGHSYGAIPAAALAARHPGLVGALGLLAPALRQGDAGPQVPPRADALGQLLSRPNVAAFLKATVLSEVGRGLIAKAADPMSFDPDPVDAEHLAGVRDRTLQWNAVRSFFLEAKTMRHEAGVVEALLGALHVPSAVVHARGDRVVDVGAGIRTASSIPRCGLHEIDGGHMLTISRADEVAGALLGLATRAGLVTRP